MDVRPLQRGDLEAFIDDLWLPSQREMSAYTDLELADDIRGDGLEHRRTRLDDDEAVTLLAERDAEYCGYVAGEVSTPPPIFEQRRKCHISELYVREGARREGVATALLGAIERWAADQSCTRVDLRVDTENTAAIECYRAAGYTVQRHTMATDLESDP